MSDTTNETTNTNSNNSNINNPSTASASGLNNNNNTSIADDLRNLDNQLRAQIVSNAVKKGLIGAATGAAFSLLIFKRKLAPVWLGFGFGLGMAYADGSQMIRSAHDSILESALNRFDKEEEEEILKNKNIVKKK